MNLKLIFNKLKAFTMTEVLTVVTIIGVTAALVLPALMDSVKEGHYKSAYKRAFASVSNIASMQKANENVLTSDTSEHEACKFFLALSDNLDIKDYVQNNHGLSYGKSLKAHDLVNKINFCGLHKGDAGNTVSATTFSSTQTYSPWIVTTDGMAFSVLYRLGSTCSSRAAINNLELNNPKSKSCLIVLVDTNGLTNGPNKIEPQVQNNLTDVQSKQRLKRLSGDRYYIYLGSDGAAKGSVEKTVSGRLLQGLK